MRPKKTHKGGIEDVLWSQTDLVCTIVAGSQSENCAAGPQNRTPKVTGSDQQAETCLTVTDVRNPQKYRSKVSYTAVPLFISLKRPRLALQVMVPSTSSTATWTLPQKQHTRSQIKRKEIKSSSLQFNSIAVGPMSRSSPRRKLPVRCGREVSTTTGWSSPVRALNSRETNPEQTVEKY